MHAKANMQNCERRVSGHDHGIFALAVRGRCHIDAADGKDGASPIHLAWARQYSLLWGNGSMLLWILFSVRKSSIAFAQTDPPPLKKEGVAT